MSDKKRIYIVVKTYPTISEEYSELVCTAGILEDGSWIRLYPVPFVNLILTRSTQNTHGLRSRQRVTQKIFAPKHIVPT